MTETEALARRAIVTGIESMQLSAQERADFGGAPFGGYILFARNAGSVADVRALTDDLRSMHAMPTLICIDQEGGRVARLRDGLEPIPSMRSLGELNDAQAARAAGEQLAHDLRRAGINIDFAPVLDLDLDARNAVVGTRAFGSDPQRVIAMSAAFAGGLEAGGICPVYKHFPGHGSTADDSHDRLPTLSIDAASWRARDLLPFAAVAASARAMMAAHVVLPAIDASNPATFSNRLLQRILRDELGFAGVCFTDCLHMGAMAATSPAQAALRAIAAGADCVLISHDRGLAASAAARIAHAVERSELPRQRLEAAVARVEALAATLSAPLPLCDPAPHPGIGRRIARRAVRAVRGVAHADPTATIVVSFETSYEAGADQRAAAVTLSHFAPALVEHRLSLDPTDGDVSAAIDAVVHARRRPLLLLRRAHVHPAQLRAVETLCARFPDAIVASVREPDDARVVADATDAKIIVCSYGDDAASLAGLADALFARA